MTVSPALLCALSCAAGAVPFVLRLSVVKRQRDNARSTASLFKDWWLAASDRALRAECRLSLAHEQHVAAGKRAHRLCEEDRARRAATTEKLRHCAPNPPRPREEIEAEVAALRAARKAQHPLEETGRGVAHLHTAGGPRALPLSSPRAGQRRRPSLRPAEQKGAM